VDLVTQQAWLIKDSQIARGPVSITSGGPGEETPQGTFTVSWKDKTHKSDNSAHTPMPYAVFFAPGGVAFHGGSLRRASAGCVHLAQQDAVAFYNALSTGSKVQVVAPSHESSQQRTRVGDLDARRRHDTNSRAAQKTRPTPGGRGRGTGPATHRVPLL
jgi:hypothetical protein